MLFKIVSEAGVAAGVRRIEALTGNGVIEYYKKQEAMLHEAAKALKATAGRSCREDLTSSGRSKSLFRAKMNLSRANWHRDPSVML